MRLILSILFSLCAGYSIAGHLIGGEISYECLGGNQYAISLKMYRDCYASGQGVVKEFDDTVFVAVYSGATSQLLEILRIPKPLDSTFIPLEFNINCIVNPPDLCIIGMEYRMVTNLTIPSSGLHLVHQRCCRTPNAINVVSPGDLGSTYYAFIPKPELSECNSSPSFNQPPPIGICAQAKVDMDFSATDIDGDSLVYRLCSPYVGGSPDEPRPEQPSSPPFAKIPWAAGYSSLNQIPSSPPFTINSQTGLLSGKATSIGDFIITVCVEEYRNGKLIGENRRDFQIQSVACDIDALAALDSTLEECSGKTVQFYNLSAIGNRFVWDFGDPTTLSDTSRLLNPVYTYPDTGTYYITLIAGGETCSDTSLIEYKVQPKLKVNFAIPEQQCFDGHRFNLEAKGVFTDTTKFRWHLEFDVSGDSIRYGKSSGSFSSLRSGRLPVHLTYSDFGCTKYHSDSLTLIPNPNFNVVLDQQRACIPFSSHLSLDSVSGYKRQFLWAFNGDTTSATGLDLEFDSAGVYDLWVQLTTDSACIDTVVHYFPRMITALDTPVAVFGISPGIADMYHPYFDVVDSSERAKSVSYTLDSLKDLSSSRNFQFFLPDTGKHYIRLVATHASGCMDTAYKTVRTKPIHQFWAPNAFTPDGDALNPVWKPSVFVWREYSLQIFNRWGEVVFTSTNPANGWNGKRDNSGTDCPMGTYAYKIELLDDERQQWHFDGTIHLLR